MPGIEQAIEMMTEKLLLDNQLMSTKIEKNMNIGKHIQCYDSVSEKNLVHEKSYVICEEKITEQKKKSKKKNFFRPTYPTLKQSRPLNRLFFLALRICHFGFMTLT